MLKRAKQWFFWQHMAVDVAQYASECEVCALHLPRQATEPLLPRPMQSCPGETVAADFFQFQKKTYLILYDVFSPFPFLWATASANTSGLDHPRVSYFFPILGVSKGVLVRSRGSL
jgi:hypothetical protein